MVNYFHLVAQRSNCNLINTWMHFLHIWTRVVLAAQPFRQAEKLIKVYRYLRHDTDEPYW